MTAHAPDAPVHPKTEEVTFTHLNTNESTNFRVDEGTTVRVVWDEAYDHLGEARRDGDQLQCADGRSLESDLDLTLAELRDRHICESHHFEIRSETGGA